MAKPMPRARTYYVRESDGTVSDHTTLAACGVQTAALIRAGLDATHPGGPSVPHPRVFLITGELESRDFPRDWNSQQIRRFAAARDRALGLRDD
jgi:hypothetical protein